MRLKTFLILFALSFLFSCDYVPSPVTGSWTATEFVDWGSGTPVSTTAKFSLFPDQSGYFIRKMDTVDWDGYAGQFDVSTTNLTATYIQILQTGMWQALPTPVVLTYEYSLDGNTLTVTCDGNNDLLFSTANMFGDPAFDPSSGIDATYILRRM
ncbi:MAG: hypothetical protein JW969_16330 [Spirochaetales bacterium]|nr:hypothetical protein [Spirochaetales bacterium]